MIIGAVCSKITTVLYNKKKMVNIIRINIYICSKIHMYIFKCNNNISFFYFYIFGNSQRVIISKRNMPIFVFPRDIRMCVILYFMRHLRNDKCFYSIKRVREYTECTLYISWSNIFRKTTQKSGRYLPVLLC